MYYSEMEFDIQALFNPDISHFKTVAVAGSFTRAAEKAGVQQAALSKAVARLEDQLGEPLFVRRRRGLELTSIGEYVLKNISSWSSQLETDVQSWTKNTGVLSGSFRLGTNQTLARSFLPGLWFALRKQYSQIELRPEFARSLEITRRVLNRDLDVGVVVNPTRRPDLVLVPLANENVFVYRHKTNGSSSALPILFNPDMLKIESLLRRFSDHPQHPVADYELIAAIASESGFLAVLPEPVGLRFKNLVKFTDRPLFSVQINLIYRRDHIKSAGGKALLRLIKTTYPSLNST